MSAALETELERERVDRKPTRPRPPPPREFIGKARLLLGRVQLTEVASEKPFHNIVFALRQQPRHRHPKTDTLIAFARLWQDLPDLYTLETRIERQARALLIEDTRLFNDGIWLTHWKKPGHEEPGISVTTTRVLLKRGNEKRVQFSDRIFVGLHALARWYQRSFDVSDEAFMTDIRTLLHQRPRILASGEQQFNCPIASGTWDGEVLRRDDALLGKQVLLRVQTLLH